MNRRCPKLEVQEITNSKKQRILQSQPGAVLSSTSLRIGPSHTHTHRDTVHTHTHTAHTQSLQERSSVFIEFALDLYVTALAKLPGNGPVTACANGKVKESETIWFTSSSETKCRYKWLIRPLIHRNAIATLDNYTLAYTCPTKEYQSPCQTRF